MSKARDGYKKLQELKLKEMIAFQNANFEVISTWLDLQKQYNDLSKKETNALMNEVDSFMKYVKKKIENAP